MAAVTICSDFGAQKNKVWHCFHCFPIYIYTQRLKFLMADNQLFARNFWIFMTKFQRHLNRLGLILIDDSSGFESFEKHINVGKYFKYFLIYKQIFDITQTKKNPSKKKILIFLLVLFKGKDWKINVYRIA